MDRETDIDAIIYCIRRDRGGEEESEGGDDGGGPRWHCRGR